MFCQGFLKEHRPTLLHVSNEEGLACARCDWDKRVSCYLCRVVIPIKENVVESRLAFVMLDDSPDEPRVLTEGLKDNEEVLVWIVDVFHIEGRKSIEENSKVSFFLIFSQRFPLNLFFI